MISCTADAPTCTFPKRKAELLAESTAPDVVDVELLPDDVDVELLPDVVGVELLPDVVGVLPADRRVDPTQPIVPSIAIEVIAKMSLRVAKSGISFGISKPSFSRGDNASRL